MRLPVKAVAVLFKANKGGTSTSVVGQSCHPSESSVQPAATGTPGFVLLLLDKLAVSNTLVANSNASVVSPFKSYLAIEGKAISFVKATKVSEKDVRVSAMEPLLKTLRYFWVWYSH